MGVDIAAYRCRVELFVSCRLAGVPFCMSFNQLVKLIGSLALIRMLLAMAGVETNPGPTEQFLFRYQYLLVEIGTELLRQLFEVKVGHDCVKHLTQTTVVQTLQKMITAKKITQDQAKYLPPVDMKPDSSNFDISLLTCLLRNVCGLRQPNDTVWMNPSPTDTSEEADITRLRLCRNWFMHRDSVVLPKAEFDDKWKELSGILIRLNNACGIRGLSALIDNASKMDRGEALKDHFDQTLKSWDAMDQGVMSKLDQIEKSGADGHARTVKTGEQRVVDLQQEMQQAMSTVHQEVRQGLSTVQQDVQQGLLTVHQGLSTLQQGVSTVRQEVATVKQGLCTVQQEIQEWLSAGQQKVTTIQEDMKLKRFPSEDAKDRKMFQLRSQLLDVGTEVLQKIFDYRVGNDFANYLTSNEAEETKLHWLIGTNRITKRQVKLLPRFGQISPSSYNSKSEKTLIPPPDQTSSSSSDKTFSSLKSTTYDISLLIVLLRYVCGLRAPNHLVWKEQPEDTDMSIEADINRLLLFRNRIMKLKHLNEENVDELWKELHEFLTRLCRRVGITDDLLSWTGDAKFDEYLDDLHMNMLEDWNANDQRHLQIEQGYGPKMFFKDSDDDTWTVDEEKVSVLLSKGLLPNAKQLQNVCEKFGSSSPTVRKVCAYICNTLQMTSHNIKRCWPAYVYESTNEDNTNLITFVVVKDIEDQLNIEEIFGYNIYEHFDSSESVESSEMMEYDIKNANKFNDEMDKIDECVSNHSLSLMHSHSNITLIAGSTVKSINYTNDKTIIEKPCVAIYIHKKGYIPLGEKPFPTKLDEFDTDVRECVVSLFANDKAYEQHDNLLMGTSISNRYSTGTLGGFVEHSHYGLCGLTCAHVLCDGHLNGSSVMKHWSGNDPIIDVIQPACNTGASIGNVVCALLRQDSGVGIDIALVRILDRFPISGQFAIDMCADLNAHEYNSGRVLHKKYIQRGAVCIKFGSETGRTESKIVNKSCCFRDDKCVLNEQLLVVNKRSPDHFAAEGDSGSLCFIEDDNGLNAIGVVVAGDRKWQSCCLTPMTDILDALNENSTVRVAMKGFTVAVEPMQE